MDIAVTAMLGILESIVALKSMNVVINPVETMEIAWSVIQPFVLFQSFHISNHNVMHITIGWTW